ncbi:MAG TPA: hypothetical protein DCR93_13820 [Cytophagales bacterium]|nr:hypothetical protein [Cytophagales bacterium]HAP60517.1 hypothetical protein [Cytophagales bacterium]
MREHILKKNKEKKYVAFWSGGKDCFLSLILFTNKLQIPRNDLILISFIANPINVGDEYNIAVDDIKLLNSHSSYFNCDHLFIVGTSGCPVTEYQSIFKYLHLKYDIQGCIRGDIFTDPQDFFCKNSERDDCSACAIRCTSPSNINVEITYPLTGLYAEDLLDLIEKNGLQAEITQVARQRHRNLLAQRLDLDLLRQSSLYPSENFDALGEKGNYHTYVYGFNEHRFDHSPTINLDFNTSLWFQVPKTLDFLSQDNRYELQIIPTSYSFIFHKLPIN